MSRLKNIYEQPKKNYEIAKKDMVCWICEEIIPAGSLYEFSCDKVMHPPMDDAGEKCCVMWAKGANV